MTETRYLPATQTPIGLPLRDSRSADAIASETTGAIVPAKSASIDRYAQDVYLALPREERRPAAWTELRTLAAQGDWDTLRAIHHTFSLQYSDNSTHSQIDRHDSYSHTDNRSLSYTDDRHWITHDVDYFTDRRTDLNYYQTDNRSWTTSDDHQFIDNSSYNYAPEVYHHYFTDNSISLFVDGSFNGNGNGNGNSSHAQLPSGRSDSEPDSWDRILQLLCFALICILAGGIWRAVNPLPIEAPAPIWQQQEMR